MEVRFAFWAYGAKGADYCAHCYARDRGINEEVFNADWKMYGKRAGPIRNHVMLNEGKPDLSDCLSRWLWHSAHDLYS